MTLENFQEQMTDLLNLEEDLDLDARLEDLEEWNSLSYVAFLAMAADFTDRTIRASEVRGAVTVRDLYDLIEKE